MYTFDEFRTEWQRRHTPTMDLNGDVDFYYNVYRCIYGIARKCAKYLNEDIVINITMYTENNATVGLDPTYEQMYRSIGDLVLRWCKMMEMRTNGYSRINEYIQEVVTIAPADSSLRQWITENILSDDFNRLNEVALFFARQDTTLGLIYPPLDYRVNTYKKLTGNDEKTAWQMLWSDLAFNWRDKKGMTILHRLAGLFNKTAEERKVAEKLLSVNSIRLDAYLPKWDNDNHSITFVNKEGRVFNNVAFSTPLPKGYMDMCFIGQLTTYLGKTYVNGPYTWHGRNVFDGWNGNLLWNEIESKEKESAKETFFTTPFGKNISLYEDLYQTSNVSVEANYSDLGIYLDEPNILNFLDLIRERELS